MSVAAAAAAVPRTRGVAGAVPGVKYTPGSPVVLIDYEDLTNGTSVHTQQRENSQHVRVERDIGSYRLLAHLLSLLFIYYFYYYHQYYDYLFPPDVCFSC